MIDAAENLIRGTLCGMAIALVLTSCSDARPDPLAEAVRADDVDSAIVESAAIDFLNNGGCAEGSGKEGIVVVDETLASDYVFSRLRPTDLQSDAWKADVDTGLPHLRTRNPRTESIDWHFTDRQTIRDVVLRGERGDAIYKAATLGKCVTTFALPGIFAGGERATVVFSIAPEYHGRLHISSLSRVDGRWRVVRRHSFEYL